MPPFTAILRQFASPLNTSPYFFANRFLVMVLRMTLAISRLVGQMSRRYTFLPLSSVPSGVRTRSTFMLPASA